MFGQSILSAKHFLSVKPVNAHHSHYIALKHSFFFLVLFFDSSSNPVQVGDSLLGQSLAVCDRGTVNIFKSHLTNETSSLQLHQAEADALASGNSSLVCEGATSLADAVVLAEGVDTDLTAHVELVSDRSSTDVEPIIIVWGELLGT